MARLNIELGTAPTGVGGDTPRSANVKINANFTELYGTPKISGLGVSGSPLSLINTQGGYIGWNSDAGISGSMNFICNRGGGTGGFTWRSVNSDNSASGPITSLGYDGVFTSAYLRPSNALELAYGGTGGTSASTAMTNLGLFAGTHRPIFASTKVAQAPLSAANTNGAYIGWNESNGGGETNFICNKGGGSGGFTWRTINLDNTATGSTMSYSYAGNLTVPGTVSQGSDRRLKINDVEITDGLEKVLAVRPVEFDRRSTLVDDEYPFHESGVIAQELYEVLPILVTPASEELGGEVWRVNYTGFIPYLISAIKELKAEIDQLKAAQAPAE